MKRSRVAEASTNPPLSRDRNDRRQDKIPYSSSLLLKDRERSRDKRHLYSNETYMDTQNFKTLCVRNISSSLDGDLIQEYIHLAFSLFGDFDIEIFKEGINLIALVHFVRSNDARRAFRTKSTIRILNKSFAVSIWDETDASLRVNDSVLSNRQFYTPRENNSNSDSLLSESHGRRRPPCEFERSATRHSPPSKRYSTSHRSRSPISAKRDSSCQHLSRLKSVRLPESPEPEENDLKATRTLFVGSLEPDITESEVRAAFERYGIVEQVDVKHPNVSHAYAFVRFANVDMALHAKAEVSGNSVRSFHCKIGFGKPIISKTLYISGLDTWKNRDELERFLLCFGPLVTLEWHSRLNYAVASFQMTEISEEACNQLKSLSFRRPDIRLIVDFIDPDGFKLESERVSGSIETKPSLLPLSHAVFPQRSDFVPNHLGAQLLMRRPGCAPNLQFPLQFPNPFGFAFDPLFQTGFLRSNINDGPTPLGQSLLPSKISFDSGDSLDSHHRWPRHREQNSFRQGQPRKSNKYARYRAISPIDNLLRPDFGSSGLLDPVLSSVVTMPDLDAFLGPAIWNGRICTKKSFFDFRCLHAVGDRKIGSELIPKSELQESAIVFSMDQQARTDAAWMVEAVHRVNIALSDDPPLFSVLLALPLAHVIADKGKLSEPIAGLEKDGKEINSTNHEVNEIRNDEDKSESVVRPLTCLVSYLRLKQKAALLTCKQEEESKKFTILLFTPSSFSLSLLKFSAPRLASELAFVDDFLILLVLRGHL